MKQLHTYHIILRRRQPGMLPIWLMLLGIILICSLQQVNAQNCSNSTPKYTIDLTGSPSGTWTSPSVSRSGQCCGAASNNRCIYFNVTLDSQAIGFRIDLSGGNGNTFYSIGCSGSYAAGSSSCVSGTGPFDISLCKPGNNAQQYTITSIPKPYIDSVAYLSFWCPAKLNVTGLTPSSITWTSISGSSYNSNLSCTSGCASTNVYWWWNFPSYVDYQVCGTPIGSCAGSTWCDTVRVYFTYGVTASITPYPAVICPGNTSVTLTAGGTGSQPPYSYLWSTGATTQSISATAGNYWVRVTDANGCSDDYEYVTVTSVSSVPTLDAGNDTTICASKNYALLNGSISNGANTYWTGGTGLFIPDSTSKTARYVPSPDEIAAGYVWLELVPATSMSCPYTRDSVKITIRPAPDPVISGSDVACINTGGYQFSTQNNSGSTYFWKVLGGSITSGQNTNQITVEWDSTPGPGYVYVEETNQYGCTTIAGNNAISKFDFNTNPIGNATTGPDAISYDADEYSAGEGLTVKKNCGGGKGADVTLPGSLYNRGRLCLAFRFKRKENEATFFSRGDLKFFISGGILRIQFSIDNGSGGKTTIGALSTGYTVPQDNDFHDFTFCYDSAAGQARLYVGDSLVYSYQTVAGRSLYWTGAGNATLAVIMDGSCSNEEYLDWANIATPISILPLPTVVINSKDTVCEGVLKNYTVTSESGYSYDWTSSGGTIVSDSTSANVTVRWNTPGDQNLTVVKTNTTTQCQKQVDIDVKVLAKPPSYPIKH